MHLDYQEVLRGVGVTSEGSTLADMAEGCRGFGLNARAVVGGPGNLERVSLPMIVHLDHWSGSLERLGHFVLLLAYDEQQGVVEYIDPISVLYHRVSVDEFRRSWSGYGIVVLDGQGVFWVVAVAAGALVAVVTYLWRQRVSKRGETL